MKIVVLDGFKSTSKLEESLISNLDSSKHTYHYFKMIDYNILPCTSCGSCNENTPGICILNDEYETIISKIAKTDLLILFTPITYGGYSSALKKIIDRFMTIGTPFYIVKNNTMLHKMRYDISNLLCIGELDNSLHFYDKSISSFKLLANRNAINMNLKLETYVYDKNESSLEINFKDFFEKQYVYSIDYEVNHV